MKKIIFIVSLLFLISCTSEIIKEPLCKAPYFEWRVGECCLDSDQNNICDSHEKPEVILEKESILKNPIPDLLKKAPKKYWFASSKTGKVAVVNDKRHSFVNVDEGITDIYWNLKKEKAWSVCDSKREILQEGSNFEITNAVCNPNTLNVKELNKAEYERRFPLSPVDWMKMYADKIPFKIESSIQTFGVRTIRPVLHFVEKEGSTIALRFDYHFKVPIVIEKFDQERRFFSAKYLFDTDFYLIDLDDNVNLPEDISSVEGMTNIIIKETRILLRDDVLVKGYVVNKGRDYIPPQDLLVECFDKNNNLIGSKMTITFEGISAYKDSEFKTYVPVSSRELSRCLVRII